jgi:hypothetical protein
MLPQNKWILGKPSGSIIKNHRGNHDCRVKIFETGKVVSKNFKYNDEGLQKARNWMILSSYKLKQTTNLIKILDKKYILVKLTQNQIMTINIEFIPLIQKIMICTTKSSKSNTRYAIRSDLNQMMRIHNLLTGYDMVDHINGNTMDNTLENLRWCNFSINNSNRHNGKTSAGHSYTDRVTGEKCIKFKMKINKKCYEKYFYLKDRLNKEEAKKLAYIYRTFILTGKYDHKLDKYMKPKEYKMVRHYCQFQIDNIKSNMKSFDDYLKGIELDYHDKQNMYCKYVNVQIRQIIDLKFKMDFIANKIYELKEHEDDTKMKI